MTPGRYQLQFRGLTPREMWRFSGEPLKFLICCALKAVNFKGPESWLPAHEAEVPCRWEDVDPRARSVVDPVLAEAATHGFREFHPKCLVRGRDPHTKQAFSFTSLHDDQRRSLYVAYLLNTASGSEKTTVTVTGSVKPPGGGDCAEVDFVDHRHWLDAPRLRKVVVDGKGLAAICRAMEDHLRAGHPARRFESFAEFDHCCQQLTIEAFESRIARGLFVFRGE